MPSRGDRLQATGAEKLLLPASPLFMKKYGRRQKQWAKSLCAGLPLSLGFSSSFTDLFPLLLTPWLAFFPHWTSWGWNKPCCPDFLTVQEKGCPIWAHLVSEFYIFTTVYLYCPEIIFSSILPEDITNSKECSVLIINLKLRCHTTRFNLGFISFPKPCLYHCTYLCFYSDSLHGCTRSCARTHTHILVHFLINS